jgi:hypothetical protein
MEHNSECRVTSCGIQRRVVQNLLVIRFCIGILLGLFLDREDGGNVFSHIVDWFSTE